MKKFPTETIETMTEPKPDPSGGGGKNRLPPGVITAEHPDDPYNSFRNVRRTMMEREHARVMEKLAEMLAYDRRKR